MRIVTNYDGKLRIENEHSVERVPTDELTSTWYDPSTVDLILVDVDSAGGSYAARVIKEENSNLPIIGITTELYTEDWTENKAVFMEQGGDYLLRHPVNPRELLACMVAIARRFGSARSTVYLYDRRLRINPTQGLVDFDGEGIQFTGKETAMFFALATRVGQVISKEQFLGALYNIEADEPEMKIIDVFICKMRKKLNDLEPGLGKVVETVWGRGYRLRDVSEEEKLAEVS